MLVLPFLLAAAPAASAASFLKRGPEEVWNGFNITAAALEIAASISSPTCNATESCQTFVNSTIPQCLRLQGTAGCWCTLHDPLHYCAICMSAPTDNTTTAAQTQSALEGHTNYHKGCGAYQAYLNASATSTSISSVSTSSLSTGSATAAASTGGSTIGTGAMVGIIVGGIIGLVLILAVTLLLYRRMQNQSKLHEVTAATGGGGAALIGPKDDFHGNSPGGDPHRVTSYYGKVDMNGNQIDYGQPQMMSPLLTPGSQGVSTPPPFTPPYNQQQQQQPMYNPHQGYVSGIPTHYSDSHSVGIPASPQYTGHGRPESVAYAQSELGGSDAQSSIAQGPLRMVSPPPAFNTIYAPQAQHPSMIGMASGASANGGVPPGVNEKAVYQGSPSPNGAR